MSANQREYSFLDGATPHSKSGIGRQFARHGQVKNTGYEVRRATIGGRVFVAALAAVAISLSALELLDSVASALSAALGMR